MSIIIRQLLASDLERLGEIDRSEHVTLGYRCSAGRLEAMAVDWDVPTWFTEGDGEHSVAAMVRDCRPRAERGVLLGAFAGERLAGIAILEPPNAEGRAVLALLQVSRPFRRQGIATALIADVLRRARAAGATSLYVSATPSESAVGFYLRQGFVPLEHPDPELFALEPEDIHMLLRLDTLA